MVPAIPPSFAIYPEKVYLAKDVDDKSSLSGSSDISDPERSESFKELLWEAPTRQLTPSGPIREPC